MATPWTDEQRAAIDDRGGTLLVSAAAGSGKTAVLVERVLKYVTDEENPCDIDSFLIVTFTKAAASEMRGKIADALGKLAAQQPNNIRLRKQLMLVHRAKITTVHAFCMSLLREHFHELGLPSDFRTADESEQTTMKTEVLEEILEQKYAEQDKGFTALAEALNSGRDDRQLTEVIQKTFDNLQSSPDPKQMLQQYRGQFIRSFDRLADISWGRELLHDAACQLEYAMQTLRTALDDMQSAPDVQEKYEETFQDDLNQAKNLYALVQDDAWDAAVDCCGNILKHRARLPAVRGYEDKAFLERLKSARNTWKDISDGLAKKVLCMHEQEVREDISMMAPAVVALCDTVEAFMEAYQAEKLRRGVVDFNDLEHFALKLLTDADGQPTALAKEMHFTEIMVDEYQDTNAVQDALFRAVSEQEKNIFMVGDVKQSIYRFRLADPDIFLHKYLQYRDAESVFDDSPRRIVLSKNFRSRPEVLDSVNYLFSALMSRQLGDLDYTDREALHVGANFPDSIENYRTELCLLETKSDDEDAPEAIRQEANYCAQRVRHMLDTGFQVTDQQTKQLRPCRPEDFVILLRSAKNKMPVFQKALLEQGIPAGAEASEDMLRTPEILTLFSCLEIADNPRQDIPLLSVLSSPLFGFTADELAQVRLCDEEHDYYTALCAAAEQMPKAKDFLDRLTKIRSLAADVPVRQLLWHIIDVTGAMGIFGAMPNGRARQHHITTLIELAGSFEQSGSRGLFAFVRYLREMREGEKGFNVSDGEETAGAVRIMTIHKSKGLEFPIVILANCAKRFNVMDLSKPVLLHERMGVSMRCRDVQRGIQYDSLDRLAMTSRMRREMVSEELRVLYVALTRAKEKLICTCALRDVEKQVEKWAAIASLDPIPAYALSGANQYALWLAVPLLRHPNAAVLRQMCSQPPEMDTFAADCFTVTVVPYTAQEQTEQKQQVVTFDDMPEMTAPVLRPYAADVLCDLPSKLTATAITDSFQAQETQEQTVPKRQEQELRRPFFERSARGLTPSEIGTAHHLFLQFCDFAQCETADGREAELDRLRRTHILSEEQADCIDLNQIAAFFASPLYAQLKQSVVHREFKFSVLVPAGDYFAEAKQFPEEQVLMQGVIDCLLETEDALYVIDFKTDRVSARFASQRAKQYKSQLYAYRRAAQEVFEKPVRSCALFFLSCGKTIWV